MSPRTLLLSVFAASLLATSSVFAQGSAIGGVLNRVEDVTNDLKANQRSVSTGPEDRLEKVAPGKIDKDAALKYTKTPSGLGYRILRKSVKRKPKANSIVVAHYKGWLDNKQIFDSSYRRGKPSQFPLDQVIDGWTEGLQLIGEGGMIELDIPYDLGYGKSGRSPKIPPRARLHFIVELVSIK